jgi:hypothetical protein
LKSAFRDYDAYKTPGRLTSERAVDPAIDSEVRALVGRVAATVVDDSADIRQSMVPLSPTHVIIVPVGSSSAPTKSDYEVARVVPVGSESSCALVGLEVCKVAIVVLNIVDGLTLLELVLCRSSKRRSHGRAEKSEKSGSELHVVRMMMIEEEWDGMMCVMDSRDLGALALLPYYSTRCYSA